METTIYNTQGKSTGKISLPESIFGLPWNADLVHEIVRLMNSNSRSPVANVKTRGEVRGGGKKPWRQKGTGRARHGSTRSPIWVGGGIAHGPRADKNFERKINKKARIKALYTILSRKMKDGEILLIDSLDIKAPKTAEAQTIVGSLSSIKGFERLATKKVNTAIIAVEKKTDAVAKSFRNIGNISLEEFRNINPVSVLNHTFLVVVNPANVLKDMSASAKTMPAKVVPEKVEKAKDEKVTKTKTK